VTVYSAVDVLCVSLCSGEQRDSLYLGRYVVCFFV
jgi:hypothetical protein